MPQMFPTPLLLLMLIFLSILSLSGVRLFWSKPDLSVKFSSSSKEISFNQSLSLSW